MANTSSESSKRAWEGNGYDEPNKRPREREREEHKDWREVHLNSPRGGAKRESADRRDQGRQDMDHRRGIDNVRDRRDDRDRDRDRDYRSRRHDSRRRSPHPSRDHRSPATSTVHSKEGSEKEDGE